MQFGVSSFMKKTAIIPVSGTQIEGMILSHGDTSTPHSPPAGHSQGGGQGGSGHHTTEVGAKRKIRGKQKKGICVFILNDMWQTTDH